MAVKSDKTPSVSAASGGSSVLGLRLPRFVVYDKYTLPETGRGARLLFIKCNCKNLNFKLVLERCDCSASKEIRQLLKIQNIAISYLKRKFGK